MIKKIRTTLSILFLFSILYQPYAYTEDYTRWGLPKGAKMRIGKGEISANITFSPDSSLLAVSSSIGIWIYDVHTGKELALLNIHEGYSTSVAFSPDGKTIACSSTNDLYIWEVETGNLIHKITGDTNYITNIAFSPDGRTLATGDGAEDQIKLWDTTTGTLLDTFIDHDTEIDFIAFSPDGNTLASVSNFEEDRINIRNVASGEIQSTINTVDDIEFEKIVYSPDGNTIANYNGWLDDKTHLWDVGTGRYIGALIGHAEEIKTVAFSPDGNTLASGGEDDTIIIWDVATRSYKKTLIAHTDFVVSIAFSPDGKTLASGSWDGTIILWDTDSFLQIGRITGHAYGFRSIAFSPSGDRIVTGSHDTTVRVWNTNTGENTITFLGHIGDIESVAFSPDGHTIASASGFTNHNGWYADDYTVRLWDVTTQTQKAVLLGHHRTIYHVTFSPDGSVVASCGDGKATFWDTETGHPVWTINGDRGELKAQNEKRKSVGWITFSPDGQRVANGDSTGIYVWDFASRQQIGTYTGMTIEAPWSVFSPNGNTLAVILENDDVCLWNIPPNESGHNLRPHATNFVRFGNTPDEYIPIAAGYWQNDKIKFMAPIESEAAITLQAKPDEVEVIAFSPDGNTLATASFGGTILLWDVDSISDPSHQMADLNNDGREGMHDVMIIAENFGKTGYNVADVNKDGIVDIEDLIRTIGTFRNPNEVLDAVRQGKDIAPTRETAKTWLYEALHLEKTDYISQLGVQFLKELIVALYPLQTALLPNYPNPFNPETWIPYQLARPADVSIRIYSTEGRLIRTLKFGHQPVGLYLDPEKAAYWNGENELGEKVASGVYFYTLTAGKFTATRKMLIRK